MSKPRITIKDIAKELKISTSTVSRALTDKWDVNPETRKAVLELAEKFNYKPNPISQNLKSKESRFVGVVVPEFINSFFSSFFDIISRTSFSSSSDSLDKYLSVISLLRFSVFK